ncbi:MAG TPA: transporter substrate-binding domain-containing protein [Burkholderiales bacterium]|nr:transporter substrate-binding domain-containing protein [Burkholderiales bacterium]
MSCSRASAGSRDRSGRYRLFDRAAGLPLALLILALVSPGAVAQSAVGTPRTIRVVTDNVYAPYSFQSDEGRPQGILIDQWQAWEKKTGIKVEIHAMNWPEALRRMRAGEFDVIDDIVETPERRDYLDFTPPYATIGASIFFRSNISGITDLASLKGFSVGAKTDGYLMHELKANGVTTVLLFPNYEAIIAAAKQQKINVFVADAPPTIYLLNKLGIEDEFRLSAPVSVREIRRAVRKGNADLLRTVSEGFAAIEPGELKRIDEKWIGHTVNKYGRYLTYTGYTAAVAILVIAGLVGWNRTLGKKVVQRTAALRRSAAELQALSRQKEEHLRLVIDTIPAMAWTVRTDGVVDFLNKRWMEYCGLSLEQYVDDPLGPVHPEDIPRVMKRWEENMAAGEPHEDEMRLRRADGEYRWFLVRDVALRDEEGNIVKWYGTSTDIEDRKRAEYAVRDSRVQLQALSRRLVELQETERRQLSRELHDRVGQNLTALKINLDILHTAFTSHGTGEVRARVDDSAALLESTMDTIEDVMSELRPPMLDDHGLAAALDWHARKFSMRTGIAVAVRGREPAVRPVPQVEIALFRIAQEALNNVAKHARAQRVEITLDHANGESVMSVQDDGIGFDGVPDTPDELKPGLGMVTMRERAQAVGGRFEIGALPARGTQLTVRVPY